MNGEITHDFPTTGALLYSSGGSINEDNAGSWCSGTLIGCNTFLTAAHCVESSSNPSRYWVLLQNAGIFQVTGIASHPSYSFPTADVAVLSLSGPVTGISPTPLNLSANPASVGFGLAGTIAGFGQSSGSAGDYGIKRWGRIKTTSCSGSPGNTALVCWDFTNPLGPPTEDSNTCNGDSGGPLFMDLGSGETVAGITSGGNNATCQPLDSSYDANVYTYRSFIQTNLGADSTSACGTIPPVGDPDVEVVANNGTLSGSNGSDSFTVNVPSGAQELRFVLNGEDNESLRVDFYAKAGTGVSTGNFDCKADGTAVVGDCIVTAPTSGTWSVLVNRTAGSGEYQLTTTIFGGDPPVCGNNIIESGEDCDGTDAGSCPTGTCDVGCSCPAPVCGNDITESGEDCDGTDAGSCPTGTCDVGCSCPAPVCGNDIIESGEDCDGTDDSTCPGSCESCVCASSCFTNDLFTRSVKSNLKTFSYNGEIDEFVNLPAWDFLDPREGFRLTVADGGNEVDVVIPADDPGWFKSKPAVGKFSWTGDRDGIRKIKAREKWSRYQWKIKVRGKLVPGAEAIDVFNTLNIRLEMAGVCSTESW